MSNAVNKYGRLVDSLLNKTKEGSIPWDYESLRSTVSVWNKSNVLLTIKRDLDENFDELYVVSLINKSGDTLEYFNDTALSALNNFGEGESYFEKLQSLYELARRQATGADKALDEFIRAIEEESLDHPF